MGLDIELDNEPATGLDRVWQEIAKRFQLTFLSGEHEATFSGKVGGIQVLGVGSPKGDVVLTIGEGSEPDAVHAAPTDDLPLLHEIQQTPHDRNLTGSALTEGWVFNCGQWRKRISTTSTADDVDAMIERGLELARAFPNAPRTRTELLTALTADVIRVPDDRARRLELILKSFPGEPATQEALRHLRAGPSDAVRCIVARELGDATTISLLIRATPDRSVRRAAIDALFSLPPDSRTCEAHAAFADWVVDLAQGKVSIPDAQVAEVAATLSMLAVSQQKTVARSCLAITAHGLRLLAVAAFSMLAEVGSEQDLEALGERESYWTQAQPAPTGPWPAVIVSEQQLAEAARKAIDRIAGRVKHGT